MVEGMWATKPFGTGTLATMPMQSMVFEQTKLNRSHTLRVVGANEDADFVLECH